MATKAIAHTDPIFAASFSELIKNLRTVFGTKDGQPFVIAGSGTLCWDQVSANLVEAGEKVLLLSCGYFGDRFMDCLETYGAKVDCLRSEIGYSCDFDQVAKQLESQAASGSPYKLVAASHVDTSSGVVLDVERLCKLVKEKSPSTLVVVGSVCAAACEDLQFDNWGVDVVFTASQKALGCPPGVAVTVASQRALQVVNNRSTPIPAYYVNWQRWLPIMEAYENKAPKYFATPCVQTIMALNVSVRNIVSYGVEDYLKLHRESSAKFTDGLKKLGLKIIPQSEDVRSHAMSAVWLPEGVKLTDLVPRMAARGVTISGGIFTGHATEYFRIGHMGLVSNDPSLGFLEKTLTALKDSLVDAGYNCA
ncbi:Alanine-glyoxylate aminotransferase 1 [Zancudomyces culisetae]|uniref:alanine--glyoxylate transaminase n=1 Tax=Zancudomyces culisetae TaxID=1213189 RepID=A0A1R1PNN0_ZANCU|nr:Alanine-glyoxylate aminotransferase 1 [Zancudomyces culisetae]|eukprot:OMH82577.1 Alanine-glyoxylate aminotransferase 1 [Zancudomyces culisetae]